MEVSAWALTRKLHKRHRRAHKGSWYRFGMGGCLKYKSVRHKYRDGFGLLRTGPVIVFLIFYVTSPGDYYGASLHRTLVRRFPLCSLFQVAAGSPNRPQELLNKPQHKLVILKRRASASGEGMKDLYRPVPIYKRYFTAFSRSMLLYKRVQYGGDCVVSYSAGAFRAMTPLAQECSAGLCRRVLVPIKPGTQFNEQTRFQIPLS